MKKSDFKNYTKEEVVDLLFDLYKEVKKYSDRANKLSEHIETTIHHLELEAFRAEAAMQESSE